MRIFVFCALLFLNVIICCNCQTTGNHPRAHSHLDVTLIGANGDLAKKYLWKGLFDLFLKHACKNDSVWSFALYGAGTRDAIKGSELLNITLSKAIICHVGDRSCGEKRDQFFKLVTYVQLKQSTQYASHCTTLSNEVTQSHCHKGFSCLYQHIFYLSVPPFAYESISEYISSHCRPHNGTGSLKVVLEKPFGHNRESASILAQSITKYLKDEEVYRVDHYLGKQSVEQIVPFRLENNKIEEMLNRKYVERIEIVMKETADVKGRTSFYDKYGVICDVMQNHLSEILYLLTMEMLTNDKNDTRSAALSENKIKLIEQISPVSDGNVVLGQYKGYQEEVLAESSDGKKATSRTPTFAGVQLKISSERWRNVAIIMVAGKMLNERTGFARFVFKDNVFSTVNRQECHPRQELIFHIGHGDLRTPAILISENLPLTEKFIPLGWEETSKLDEVLYMNSKVKCYHVFVPVVVKDAYTSLIEQVFFGHQEYFLTTPALLDSWKVWGPLVDQSTNLPLKLYPGGQKNGNSLDFRHDSRGLKFQNTSVVLEEYKPVVTKDWLGHSAITGESGVVFSSLARSIMKSAKDTVESGHEFHIAFSGGSSPLKLFSHLAMQFDDALPWEKTHIWQVDERCTSDATLLNFGSLSTQLIDLIPSIKYKNVHPMLLKTSTTTLCGNSSALLYEQDLRHYLGTLPQLDYIVLGLGSDGHTASLFPYHSVLDEKERFVAVANDVPVKSTPRRITLTYPTINTARNIAVLVSGISKCSILNKLKETQCKSQVNISVEYPICGVSPLNGNVTWYINASCDGIL